MRDVITQNYSFDEKNFLLEKRKQKIALEISVFRKLAHVEQVFGGCGSVLTKVYHRQDATQRTCRQLKMAKR